MPMRSAILVAVLSASPSIAAADPATGSVKGTVLFEGEPPAQPVLKRDSEPKCAKDRHDEAIVVAKGKLRDVVVRIKTGTAGEHKPPAEPVVIDQRDCMYTPRVVGLVAGQQLVVRNSDKVFHNVWGVLKGKDLWNTPQQPGGPELKLDPAKAKPGDVVELQCGVHAWMHAYAAVSDNPYFAVTGDTGAFEIKGLPQGSYTLEAWHPVLGTKSIPIQIGKGKRGDVTARFSYKASEM
jgi:hypothetical protein